VVKCSALLKTIRISPCANSFLDNSDLELLKQFNIVQIACFLNSTICGNDNKWFCFLSKYVLAKKECEAFFRSAWYGMLTAVDGEMLISALQKEVIK